MRQVPVVAVVGATAAGKTELSLDLAENLGGEVVNTDAMQVYRGMDVGTAKPAPDERRGIVHHLLDTHDPAEPVSVAVFQAEARAVIAELRGRGVVPVLVGGSALYTRAVLDRFEFPGTDAAVRRRLEDELVEVGAPAMHARLTQVDPDAAAQILPDNARRIVRALEVGELTGQSFTATLPRLEYVDPLTVQVGVAIDRPTLDERIAARVRQMYDDGLVEEVQRLGPLGPTAATAIGYRQAAAHLAGELTLEDAIEQTTTATRRFARRQESWFRKDPRIEWVDHDDPDRLEKALAAVRGT
ncbi:MAG: tRNA (adenosine(37)-N6)-dimethylallyltransferase MiaA [Nocardioides sp.]